MIKVLRPELIFQRVWPVVTAVITFYCLNITMPLKLAISNSDISVPSLSHNQMIFLWICFSVFFYRYLEPLLCLTIFRCPGEFEVVGFNCTEQNRR